MRVSTLLLKPSVVHVSPCESLIQIPKPIVLSMNCAYFFAYSLSLCHGATLNNNNIPGNVKAKHSQ